MTKEFGSKRGTSGETNDWDGVPTVELVLELKQGCTTCNDEQTSLKLSLITKETVTCEEAKGVSLSLLQSERTTSLSLESGVKSETESLESCK